MDNLPVDQATLVSRAKGILLDPGGEWAKVATETDPPKSVFMRYALPLALIGPIASFIGGQLFGLGGFGISIRLGLMQSLTIAVVSFVMSLVGLWLVAWVANMLSPSFGGKSDFPAAFRLCAYSWTAAWVAGIFGLLPALGILALLVSLYGFYVLHKGVTPVMAVPQDKAVGYTVVTVLCAIVALFLANLVVGAVTAPMMMAGMTDAAGNMSIDMGENGSMESNGDGTMTITGPDGEEMTITVDDNR